MKDEEKTMLVMGITETEQYLIDRLTEYTMANEKESIIMAIEFFLSEYEIL